MWASDGHLHPELQPQANKLLKQLKGAKKMLKKPLGADIPIEKKVEAISNLSKYGAIGSFLVGVWQLFTGTAWSSLISASFGAGISVNMAALCGVVFFKAAFFLAVLAFAIGALHIIIKVGKVAWRGLVAGTEIVGMIMKPAIATGKFFLKGVGKFLKWIDKKLGLDGEEETTSDSVQPFPEYTPPGSPPQTHRRGDLPSRLGQGPPGGPIREVQKLQEALNFINFFENLKLQNA